MDSLEREVRGITHVDRDADGSVLLTDVPTDLDALLGEAERAIATAEARLREREDAIRKRGEAMLRERKRTGRNPGRASPRTLENPGPDSPPRRQHRSSRA
jgi:hypothetical protein